MPKVVDIRLEVGISNQRWGAEIPRDPLNLTPACEFKQ